MINVSINHVWWDCVEYTLITTIAIVTTTLFVHQLANRILGIRLGIKPLALCGVCSLFLSLVLPRIVVGFAGLAGTIGVLAIFAIIFAYFVAYYEDSHAVDSFSSESNFTAQALNEKKMCEHLVPNMPIVPSFSTLKENDLLPSTVASYNDVPKEEVSSEFYEVLNNNLAKPVAEEPIAEEPIAEESIAEEPIAEELIVEEPIAEELIVEEPIVEEPIAEELLNTQISLDIPSITDKQCQEGTIVSSSLDTTGTLLTVNEMEQHNEVTEVVCTMNHQMPISISDSLPDTQDLDALLDYAFSQKEKNNYEQALVAFRHILKLFPEDGTPPFVVIEIGNILKLLGSYDDAIQIFMEGKARAALHEEYQFEQEFISTIAYLRIIKNTLIHRRLGLIPYNKIPEDIFEEINAEFREWRNLA
jgi:tetratricopeptide (TPR) repeat protein